METGNARSPRAPQPDQAATSGKKNPAPFDKVRDRNLEDQRSRSLGDQLVPRKGLEPSPLARLVPETSASTNSATWAPDRCRSAMGFV